MAENGAETMEALQREGSALRRGGCDSALQHTDPTFRPRVAALWVAHLFACASTLLMSLYSAAASLCPANSTRNAEISTSSASPPPKLFPEPSAEEEDEGDSELAAAAAEADAVVEGDWPSDALGVGVAPAHWMIFFRISVVMNAHTRRTWRCCTYLSIFPAAGAAAVPGAPVAPVAGEGEGLHAAMHLHT